MAAEEMRLRCLGRGVKVQNVCQLVGCSLLTRQTPSNSAINNETMHRNFTEKFGGKYAKWGNAQKFTKSELSVAAFAVILSLSAMDEILILPQRNYEYTVPAL